MKNTTMEKHDFEKKLGQYYALIHETGSNPAALYLDNLAPSGRRSMRSLLNTAMLLLGFDDVLEQQPWHLIEFRHLADLRTILTKAGKSTNTINLTLSAMKGVLGACFSLGLISGDKWLMLREVKPVRGAKLPSGRALSKREAKAILAACKREKSALGTRDGAMIGLMLATGLRRSEVVTVQLDDYNSRNGQLNILSGKGNKQRVALIDVEWRRLIRPWLNLRGREEGYLFNPIDRGGVIANRGMSAQSLYNIVRWRSETAGVGVCRPHDLRRTYVTWLLQAGVDLNTVRQMVGHSSIETTARYDLRDDEAMRRAVKCLGLAYKKSG